METPPRRPRLSPARRLLFVMVAASLACGIVELGLQALSLASTRVHAILAPPWSSSGQVASSDPGPAIPDARLDHRPSPQYPGHDERGFRNPRGIREADVVALGDSQTYGVNAAANEAWPAQLGLITGLHTYSMAYGGWGPAHYLNLLPEALALRPRVVVFTLYGGNDLRDAYHLVHVTEQLTHLAAEDQATLDALDALELNAPLDALFDDRVATWRAPVSAAVPMARAASLSPHRWISDHCKLYGLLRAVRYQLSSHPDAGFSPSAWAAQRARAAAFPRDLVACDVRGIETVLTPVYRLLAIAPDEPRIAEGRRITLRAARELAAATRAAGATPVAVRIPTKELVYAVLISEPTAEQSQLVALEQALWSDWQAALSEEHVICVDPLPALRAALDARVRIYPPTDDGHPLAAGYRVLAEAAAGAVKTAANVRGRE